jgi:hemolysin activation/secretion protein
MKALNMTKQFTLTKINVAIITALSVLSSAQVFAAGPVVNIPRAAPAPLPTIKPADVEQEAKPAFQPSGAEDLKVTVTGFSFTGNSSVTSEQLDVLLVDYRGREIGLAELNQAVGVVTAFYREQGFFLAQAYLPVQDIQGGAVEIAVLEGKVGAVNIGGSEGLNEDFLTKMASFNLLSGYSVTDKNLVRNISTINSLPGISATIQLSPSDTVGSTDVNIEFEALPTVQAWLEGNTYGNRFTGREQLSAGLKLNNLVGIGDQFLMSLKRANGGGQRAAQFAYFTPISASGALLSLNYSLTDYELGGSFEALGAEGSSQYINMGVSQPLFRDSTKGVAASFNLTRQKINDELKSFSLENKRDIDSIDIGLLGDYTSKAQDAVYQVGATLRFGDVQFKNDIAKLLDQTGAKASGKYTKFNINATRVQFFNNGLSLNVYADYQLANQNLDAAEKLSIGGINRWRGFAELPALADNGIMVGTELRKRIAANTSLASLSLVSVSPYVFADFGRGRINQDPVASNSNHVESTQYGVGMDLAFKNDWALSVTGSHQTRDFENDGAENESRFWGKLQKNF